MAVGYQTQPHAIDRICEPATVRVSMPSLSRLGLSDRRDQFGGGPDTNWEPCRGSVQSAMLPKIIFCSSAPTFNVQLAYC
ncbi:hypothetical protein J6590_096622 [Homalodisca vitripennis]|nr:hypothetical protein J6590_096622 [Homalodisca vitripennis]